MTDEMLTTGRGNVASGPKIVRMAAWLAVPILFYLIYRPAFWELYKSWRMTDSYYSHGFLIPPISLYFVWRKRDALLKTPLAPCAWGYVPLVGACLLVLMGDYLGFRVFAQLSLIPMLTGLILVLLGKRHALLVWFPLVFLVFMIPIPASLTQSLVLRVKLLATESAVQLAQWMSLPMVREGSFVHFGDDKLLVGEVCGGLRSLIALLAFGALMSYISKTRLWARLVILVVSGPIAVISNVLRILFLCVAGYFWGSNAVVGRVHDVSGILIFVVAFAFLFSLESLLRRVAPAPPTGEADV